MLVAIIDVPIVREFFMAFFVFLFAFVFIYVILKDFKIEGGDKKFSLSLNAGLATLIAVSLALLLVFTKETRIYLISVLPWVTFGILVFVIALVFLNLAGVNIFKDNLMSKTDRQLVALAITAFILFVIFFELGNVFSNFFIDSAEHSTDMDYITGKYGFTKMLWAIIFNPQVFSVVLLLIIAGVVVYFLTKD